MMLIFFRLSLFLFSLSACVGSLKAVGVMTSAHIFVPHQWRYKNYPTNFLKARQHTKDKAPAREGLPYCGGGHGNAVYRSFCLHQYKPLLHYYVDQCNHLVNLYPHRLLHPAIWSKSPYLHCSRYSLNSGAISHIDWS